MHVCSPINIKSARDDNNDIAAGIITVNNFFAHWIKEIGTKSYGDDIPILPLTNTFEKTLYSKGKVILSSNRNRQLNNTKTQITEHMQTQQIEFENLKINFKMFTYTEFL